MSKRFSRTTYTYDACGKRAYRNERLAEAALDDAQRHGRDEQRIYRCQFGNHHLSSQSAEQRAARITPYAFV